MNHTPAAPLSDEESPFKDFPPMTPREEESQRAHIAEFLGAEMVLPSVRSRAQLFVMLDQTRAELAQERERVMALENEVKAMLCDPQALYINILRGGLSTKQIRSLALLFLGEEGRAIREKDAKEQIKRTMKIKQIIAHLVDTGLSEIYIRECLLPDWWDDEFGNAENFAEIEVFLSQMLTVPLACFRNATPIYENLRGKHFQWHVDMSEQYVAQQARIRDLEAERAGLVGAPQMQRESCGDAVA